MRSTLLQASNSIIDVACGPTLPLLFPLLSLPWPLLRLCKRLCVGVLWPFSAAFLCPFSSLLAAIASSVYALGSAFAKTLKASSIGRYPVQRLRTTRGLPCQG